MRTMRLAVLISIVMCGAAMAIGQTAWVYDPTFNGIDPGPPGSWDANGCWIQSVVFDGSTYHAFYSGMGSTGFSEDVGHATSPDRVTWTKDPANPVLLHGGPGAWDDQAVIGGPVLWDGSEFHMWYGGLHQDDNIERACYATSLDGTIWTKQACNLPGLEPGIPGPWDQDTVRPSAVIFEGGTYRMWYSGAWYLGAPGWSGRVGYAESQDGFNWTKRPQGVLNPDPASWEEIVVGFPFVVFDGFSYHMWYTGGTQTSSVIDLKIGYAYSTNGINWTKSAANPVIEMANGFAASSPVFFDGATWHMWHTHSDGNFPWLVSYATSTCCAGLFGDDLETGDTSLWSLTVP